MKIGEIGVIFRTWGEYSTIVKNCGGGMCNYPILFLCLAIRRANTIGVGQGHHSFFEHFVILNELLYLVWCSVIVHVSFMHNNCVSIMKFYK